MKSLTDHREKNNRRARIYALREELFELEAEEHAELVAEKVKRVTSAPAPAEPPRRLKKSELAQHLGVSTVQVDRLDREGQPFIRIGDAKRYDLAEVLAWHASRTSSKPAPAPAPEPEPAEGVVRCLTRRAR